VTILQAIGAAIEAGRLQEPFTARDAAAALKEHHFSYGSIQVSLASYSRGEPDRPLRRVGRGTYRLGRQARRVR
jgi:hypothetical protein